VKVVAAKTVQEVGKNHANLQDIGKFFNLASQKDEASQDCGAHEASIQQGGAL
jgi:hypothetical protein